MKVIFNDQYEYPITMGRENYNGNNERKSFTISFPYSKELGNELEEFFNSTIITNFKIINSKNEELYSTNDLIYLNQIYTNIMEEKNFGMHVEFVERSDKT